MALINSSNFLLYKDQTPLGHSKSTIVNFDVDLPEATTKDSEGWKEYIAGLRSCKIKAEGLTDYSKSLNFEQLADLVIARQKINFYFKDFISNKHIVAGTGFVDAVSEKAEKESAVSFQLDITLTSLASFSNDRLWNTIFDRWNEIALEWQNV